MRLVSDKLNIVGRVCRRQDSKNDDLDVFVHVEYHLSDIGRRPFAKHLAQRGKIARLDQAFDFGYENFADHSAESSWAFVTLTVAACNVWWIEQSLARRRTDSSGGRARC